MATDSGFYKSNPFPLTHSASSKRPSLKSAQQTGRTFSMETSEEVMEKCKRYVHQFLFKRQEENLSANRISPVLNINYNHLRTGMIVADITFKENTISIHFDSRGEVITRATDIELLEVKKAPEFASDSLLKGGFFSDFLTNHPHLSFRMKIGDTIYNLKGMGEDPTDGYLIGTGALGRTFLGTGDGEEVAVKIARVAEDNPLFLENECKILTKIYTEGLKYSIGSRKIKIKKIGRSPLMFIVMEKVKGLELLDWIRYHTPSLHDRLSVLKSLAKALQELHSKEFCHGDLKLENVMVELDQERRVVKDEKGESKVKLIDFGLSIDLSDPESVRKMGRLPSGTLNYFSPERITRAEKGKKDDLYAFGVIASQLLTASASDPGFPVLKEPYSATFWERRRGCLGYEAQVKVPEGVDWTEHRVYLEVVNGCLSSSLESRLTIDRVVTILA